MSEVLDGDAEGARQAEVCEFEQALPVDEQILGFQVAMQHFVSMALLYSVEQLVQIFLQSRQSVSLRRRECHLP